MRPLKSYKFTDRPLLSLVAFALLLLLTGLICGERLATRSIILAASSNAADSSQYNLGKTPATNPDPKSIIVQGSAGCPAPSFGANATLPSQMPNSVVIADLNNDNKPDIVSANFGANTVTVALGDGAGGFGPSQTYPSGFGAISIATGDFNGDAKLDLAVANWFDHQVAVSPGVGDGSFGSPLLINVGSGPTQVVAVDFNLDGKLDFATTNFFDNKVAVFLGDGMGGFSQATGSPVAVGTSPRSLRSANLNGDNIPDLAVANEGGSVSILLGNGPGGFSAVSPIPINGKPHYIDSGDFNGDGKLDLAVAQSDASGVAILIGNGLGGFPVVNTVLAGGTPRGLVATDLTGDGRPDVVLANYDANTVTVLLNNGTGTLSVARNIPMGTNPRAVAAGDLNNDGKPDLAVANAGSGNISVVLGRGGGEFGGPVILPVPFNPAGALAVGDYNGDGRPDLAVGHPGGVIIQLGNTAGGFTPAGNFNFGFGQPTAVVTPDINHDGKLDLVALGEGLRVLLGLGDGSFGPATTSPVGVGAMSLASGDFNNDGELDFATANYGANNLSILLGNGLGGFSVAPSVPVTGQTPFVVAGDFNNDGKTDLIASRRFQNDLMPFVGDGAGNFTFVAGTLIPLGIAAPHAIAVNDLNGDGQADLAVTTRNPFNHTINSVTVLLGNGSGGFSAPTNYPVAANPTSIVVSDFNGDGNPDLATANRDADNLSVLLGNGAGVFGSAVNFIVGPHPGYLATADVTADGIKDLIAATDQGVALLLNSCTAPPVNPPTLSIDDAGVTEGDAGTTNAVFTVTLSAPSTKTISVGFNTFVITATSGVDFQPAAGRLLFTPGSTTQTVTVPILADLLDEFDETIGITLKEELNASLNRSQGVATILDNDPPPSVSINDVSLQEGNSGTTSASFTVGLSAVSGKPITLQYNTMDQSATSTDYVSKSGIISIPAGTISSTITVQVNGDTMFEPDETFVVLLSNPNNVEINDAQGQGTIVNDDAALQFNATQFSVAENNNRVEVTVIRAGAASPELIVEYATSDTAGLTNCNVINGIASARCDYATSVGRLRLAAGETLKTISIPLVDDGFAEGNESFTITLSNVLGGSLGTPATATVTINDNETSNGANPIDQTPFFVRQHYIDFLSREPDPPGAAAWEAVINNCPAGDTTCDRIHVSSAFFRSPEFQGRGYFIYRFYPVAFGRKPEYVEFVPDLAKVSGFLSDAELGAAKVAFIAQFMSRPAFVTKYNGLNDTQYVDTLLTTAEVTSPHRDFWIAALGNGTRTRATVLRDITESPEVYNKYFNQAFVVMQYFGYLRRDPDVLYVNWIQVLDSTGDFRGMVNGFMNSLEYRFRFGP